MPTPTPTFELNHLVESLFRHKKKAIALSLLAIAIGTLAILFYPRKYRSEAKVFLQVGRESVGIDPTATTGQTISLQQSGREDEVKSASDVIRSRGLIAKVVERVGADVVLGKTPLHPGEAKQEAPSSPAIAWLRSTFGSAMDQLHSIDPVPTKENAVLLVERSLNVDSEQDSTVLDLTYDAQDPELAQRVLETVVEVFLDEHLRIHRNQKSREFLGDQNDILAERLETAKKKLSEEKSKIQLSSVDARMTTLESHLSDIDADRLVTQQSLATARASMRDLEEQLSETPERLVSSKTMAPNQGADLLRDQLYELQVKKIELEARYSDSHPLVQAINGQVQQAEAIVNKQTAERAETVDDVNPIHRQLTLDFKTQQAAAAGHVGRLATLERQRSEVMNEIVKLNAAQVRLDRLDLDVQLARQKVLQYSDNYEQSRIDSQLQIDRVSNVSILQDATLAHKPVSPSKMLIGLATILFSVAAPVALALGLERTDDRLKREREVEELFDLPVFTSTPDSAVHRRLLAQSRFTAGVG